MFLLSEAITSAERMRAVNQGLARMLGGDMAATDATRINYGNRAAEIHYVGGDVGPELLRELVADAALPDDTNLPAHEIVSRRSFVVLERQQELRHADGRWMLLCDVPPKTPVHCPVHPDEIASAFVIQNRHGVPGVYCSGCPKSYLPDDRRRDEYDPDDFVRTAQEIASAAKPISVDLDSWPNQFGLTHERLTGCRVRIVSGQAAPAELLPGITLVRSDKGTGKTEAMRRLAARVKTVLSVGHRRTLIRGSCKRLGLICYLDLSNRTATPGSGGNGGTLAAFMWEDENGR